MNKKTFLIIATSNYTGSRPSCTKIVTGDCSDLEEYGWDLNETYCLINTDKAIMISDMQVGDCVESNEYWGKDSTLYRIG